MKTVLHFFLFLLLASSLFAQAPQGINYQAVIRDNNGAVMGNQSVGIRINLHTGNAGGPIGYAETHTAMTDPYGGVSFVIGQGAPMQGSFAGLSWGVANHFIEVMVDPTGGVNYQTISTQQLMSVPYALYAETAGGGLTGPQGPQGPAGPQGAPGGNTCTSGNGNAIVVYTANYAYAYCRTPSNPNGVWNSRSLSGNIVATVASDSAIVIYTDVYAYAFSTPPTNPTGTWTSQSLSGSVQGHIVSRNNIVVYTDSYAYGFCQPPGNINGDWTSRSLSAPVINTWGTNDFIVIYSNSYAYSFCRQPGNLGGIWNSQSLSGTPLGIIGR